MMYYPGGGYPASYFFGFFGAAGTAFWRRNWKRGRSARTGMSGGTHYGG